MKNEQQRHDISDAVWSLLEPHLPGQRGQWGGIAPVSYTHLDVYKRQAFCRKIDTKTDDYGTVLKTISDFLTKPFSAAISSNNFSAKWHTDVCLWK